MPGRIRTSLPSPPVKTVWLTDVVISTTSLPVPPSTVELLTVVRMMLSDPVPPATLERVNRPLTLSWSVPEPRSIEAWSTDV